MSARPVIDAGPGLNFFALNKERLLITILVQLGTPETVRNEILRKARTDKRFTCSHQIALPSRPVDPGACSCSCCSCSEFSGFSVPASRMPEGDVPGGWGRSPQDQPVSARARRSRSPKPTCVLTTLR